MGKKHKIVITGALGQIAYSLIFRLLSGELLGPDEKFELSLLDIEPLKNQFPGLVMEIEDSGSTVVQSITCETDPYKAFRDATIVFMLGAKPRTSGMERKDLLKDNGAIFQVQGRALNETASRDVKVLVVGNPCHTNCLIAQKNAPDLSFMNFCAMNYLDECRARALLASKIACPFYEISPVAIWGNHSSTLVADAFSSFHIPTGKKISDLIDPTWLVGEYIQAVQQRGAEVIRARGKSSAASAASSALLSMKAWIGKGAQTLSIGRLACNNPYGIDEELVFSFPSSFSGQYPEYAVHHWKSIPPQLIEKVRLSEKELLEERDAIRPLITVH